eukprot:CAMPEP_0179425662 /NCGR_PEP_ID=MMETSP0799-20121207/12298_1 /TAXON_ID=46947 /ORGANISM="Geminigera cryophila, Strain CCMP2564" /LENGTH=149 /DNA_ID=CAMNT_0021200309 /DNA_START=27 /DNA_END=473 /DNA_ORIENTATION=-
MAEDLDAEFALFESEVAALEGDAPAEDTAAADSSTANKNDALAATKEMEKPVEKSGDGSGGAGVKRARVEYASAPVKRSVTHGFSPSVDPAPVETEQQKEQARKREEANHAQERQGAANGGNGGGPNGGGPNGGGFGYGGSNSTPLGAP